MRRPRRSAFVLTVGLATRSSADPVRTVDSWPVRTVADETLFSPTNECEWWTGDHFYDYGRCSSFLVNRLAPPVVALATERAAACAAQAATDCVLSGEIGFAVPAAFIYDVKEGMRMILAPHPVESKPAPDAAPAGVASIRLQQPEKSRVSLSGTAFQWNRTIRVEHIPPGRQTLRTETFHGADAYCIQSLRAAVLPECWQALDG